MPLSVCLNTECQILERAGGGCQGSSPSLPCLNYFPSSSQTQLHVLWQKAEEKRKEKEALKQLVETEHRTSALSTALHVQVYNPMVYSVCEEGREGGRGGEESKLGSCALETC